MTSGRGPGRTPSPLWHRALERYQDELQGIEDYDNILKIHSLQELINSFSSVRFPASEDYSGVVSLHRLAPRLKFVDDFSAVLALCFGADATLTATVWGSIRLILDQASSAYQGYSRHAGGTEFDLAALPGL
ncbi:hypothetical protein F5144DRAFT_647945 [Chaetomium tenue]|uniref:Uncharacterized protein n=1 Tax=Chaetomium tenue TaxID=1854479 RepID=A0ACB7P953_9PEZI|nr:hypothetical protein F5144DRAFT_647945 [Chaetomium globosum]